MIAGMIESFVNADKYEDKIRTMMVGNLVLTFGWEIFQLFPEKHLFRHLPAAAQDFTAPRVFATISVIVSIRAKRDFHSSDINSFAG